MQTGFVHAVDAVLAGVILLSFMGAMFPPQEEVNWDAVHLRLEAHSLMSALKDAHLLDKIVLRDDKQTLDAFVQSVSQNKEFVARVYNVPDGEVSLGYLIGDNATVVSNVSRGDWNGSGLPDAEHYANGTLFSVPFVLSDTQFDGVERYDSVNFDYEKDGLFNASGDPGEGPWQQGTTFVCDAHFANVSACNGDPYTVGPLTLSEGLVVHNASNANAFAQRVSVAQFDGFRTAFSVSTVNPSYRRVGEYDILFIPSESNVSQHTDALNAFLDQGGSVLRQTNTINDFETDTLGFEDRAFPPAGTGTATFEQERNASGYYPKQFFSSMEMQIHDYIAQERFFEERNASEPELLERSGWNITNMTGTRFSTGNFFIAGEEWRVVTPSHYNATYVSDDTTFTWDERIEEGGRFVLDDGAFKATRIFPFAFQPLSGYEFTLNTLQASSDTPVALFDRKHYQDGTPAQAVLYTDSINGTGEAAVIGEAAHGLDYDNLLKSVALFLTIEDRELGGTPLRQTPIGDNSIGVTHFSVPQSDVTVPYGLQFIWWYA